MPSTSQPYTNNPPGGASNVKDPLADTKVCKRDIAKFKDLGLNTIRVYSIDNSVDHDECMRELADAGIYLMLDVNTPLYSLNRANPRRSYNDVYLQNVFATVDMFAKYDNLLAFFSGNEVINDAGTTQAAPFVKAVTRDIRQYIGTRNYRKIPVGYSAADVSENRKEMADYMNCGSDDERSDFFAFNDYSWCDPSDFKKSGWDQKVCCDIAAFIKITDIDVSRSKTSPTMVFRCSCPSMAATRTSVNSRRWPRFILPT